MSDAYQTGAGIWPWVIGLLTLAAGGYMAGNATVAAATLTIALTAYLLVAGIADILFALQLKPFDGWKFVLASGVLSLVLGVLIWSQFPLSGPFAIGIILGIKLLASGLLLVYLGNVARSLASGRWSAAGSERRDIVRIIRHLRPPAVDRPALPPEVPGSPSA